MHSNKCLSFISKMIYKEKFLFLIFSAIILAACFPFFTACQNHPKPNIIFILFDDLSWGDLSINGQDHFSTPNIDKLAAGGMQFTNAYAGASEWAP